MVTAETLQQLFNQALTTGEFPSNLKNTDVAPVFKKNNPLHKENYKLISVLPVISKVFEKLMQLMHAYGFDIKTLKLLHITALKLLLISQKVGKEQK